MVHFDVYSDTITHAVHKAYRAGPKMRSCDENSVCPSVRICLSNACIVTKRKKNLSRFLYHACERSFSLVLWEEEWLVGATPSIWNFGSTGTRWSEIADFEPIIARSASAVRPSEKSSINTHRKSPALFPMSLRWSSYVGPKSPKGGLKNAKQPFSVYNRTSLDESLLQSFFVWKLSAAKLYGIHWPNYQCKNYWWGTSP